MESGQLELGIMTSSSQTTVSDAGYPKVLYLILLVAEVLFLFFLVSYSIGSTAGYAEGSTAGYAEGSTAGYAEGSTAGYAEGSTAGYAEGSTAGYNSGYRSGYRQATETGKKIWYDRRSNYDPAYFQIPTK